jgi:hypothetical protein
MIEILQAVQEFYLLQMMDQEKCTEPFLKSHERWLRDFGKHKELFEGKLAAALHDYIFIICGGEARHASMYSTRYIPDFPSQHDSRPRAYQIMPKFNPEKCVDMLINLFDGYFWHKGYGGESWTRIARALKLFYNKPALPKAVLIDHCVNISHNGGLAFDKIDAGIFRYSSGTNYVNFLNYRRDVILLQRLCEYTPALPAVLFDLLQRAGNLQILPKCTLNHSQNVRDVLEYCPVTWGDHSVELLVPNGRTFFDEYGYDDKKEYPEKYEAKDKTQHKYYRSTIYYNVDVDDFLNMEDKEDAEEDVYAREETKTREPDKLYRKIA